MGSFIPCINLYVALCHSIPYWQVCWDHSEMCVIAPFTFPCGSTNSNLKVSQRCPIDQIIYHFIAFGQLLLFVGWNVWIFLLVCFLPPMLPDYSDSKFRAKVIIYSPMVIVVICFWITAATGRLGEVRWWPSRDCLFHLVPPSIKNATVTKCRWTLLLYQS